MTLWQQLTQITSTHFQITEKGTHLLQGDGVVQIEKVSETELILTEKGKWILNDGQLIDYRSRYRWRWDNGRIHIAQWRGEEPVHLVTLRPTSPQEWHTEEAHLCGTDYYSAQLIQSKQLQIEWTIIGDKKNHHIIANYE